MKKGNKCKRATDEKREPGNKKKTKPDEKWNRRKKETDEKRKSDNNQKYAARRKKEADEERNPDLIKEVRGKK